jgi:hypothetical protein
MASVRTHRRGILAGTGLDSRAWAEASGLAGEHRHGEREASSSTPASSLISPDSRPQLAGFRVSSTTTRRHRRLRPRDLGLRRRARPVLVVQDLPATIGVRVASATASSSSLLSWSPEELCPPNLDLHGSAGRRR